MKNLRIDKFIPVQIEWEDNIGFSEVELDLKVGNFSIFGEMYLSFQDDKRLYGQGRTPKHKLKPDVSVEELFVEDLNGNKTELSDTEYDLLIKNITKKLRW